MALIDFWDRSDVVSLTRGVGHSYQTLALEVSTDDSYLDKFLDVALADLCRVSSEQERAQLADRCRDSSEQERPQRRRGSICKKPLMHPRAVGDLPRFMLHTDEGDASNTGGWLSSLLVTLGPTCSMALSSVPPCTGDEDGS